MALGADLATHLSGLSIGLSLGATGNVFATAIPDGAPSAAVGVVQVSGGEPTRSFGPALDDPVLDPDVARITVRSSDASGLKTAQVLAKSIHDHLDQTAEATLSGTRYLLITAMSPPTYQGQDANDRHLFSCDYQAKRER